MKKTSISKTTVFCVIGTVLEWYDYAIFGLLAPVISRLFFPTHNHVLSLLLTFAVFATGFIVRPIGGAIFGCIGDKIGRKKTLVIVILLMMVPTMLIGLMPTYYQIGIFAPIALLLCRIFQGLAVSGEYAGVITFLSETVPAKRSSFYLSFILAGVVGGVFLGSAVSAATYSFASHFLYSIGWRLPFLISILLGIVGYYMRRHLAETPLFLELMKSCKTIANPINKITKNYYKEIFIVCGLFFVSSVAFYMIFFYLPVHYSHLLGITLHVSFLINTLGMLVLMILLPVCGWVADRTSEKLLLAVGSAGFAILTVPLFMLADTGSVANILISQVVFAILTAIYFAPLLTMLANMFPVAVRYTGVGVSLNVAVAAFGGTAPLIATFLVLATKNNMSAAYYLVFSAIISLMTILWMIKSNKQSHLMVVE